MEMSYLRQTPAQHTSANGRGGGTVSTLSIHLKAASMPEPMQRTISFQAAYHASTARGQFYSTSGFKFEREGCWK